jgi:hypothetical protein
LLQAASLEFSGFLQSKTETRFMITDLSDRKTSGWIVVGDTFRGYALVAFDAKDEAVVLKKGAETVRLPVKQAKVVDVAATLRKHRVISIVQNGDLLIGDLPVRSNSLEEILRQLAKAIPEGEAFEILVKPVVIGSLSPSSYRAEAILMMGIQIPELRRLTFKVVQ